MQNKFTSYVHPYGKFCTANRFATRPIVCLKCVREGEGEPGG